MVPLWKWEVREASLRVRDPRGLKSRYATGRVKGQLTPQDLQKLTPFWRCLFSRSCLSSCQWPWELLLQRFQMSEQSVRATFLQILEIAMEKGGEWSLLNTGSSAGLNCCHLQGRGTCWGTVAGSCLESSCPGQEAMKRTLLRLCQDYHRQVWVIVDGCTCKRMSRMCA